MIFHKFKLDDRQTVINEIYDDELVTFCTGCGLEMDVDTEMMKEILVSGGSFDSTSFLCGDCSKTTKDDES